MRTRLGRVLLVVALLIAQQSALAHSIWHIGAAGQHGVASQPADSQGARNDRLCDLHTALATVLGVLNARTGISQFGDIAHPGFIVSDTASAIVFAPPPSSRGPPHAS
jgi:hypothetical protein